MGTPGKKESEVRICSTCGYTNSANAVRCHRCAAMLHFDGQRTRIEVSGIDAEEVQKVSLVLLEKTKPSNVSPSPWASGSFYLIVFIVVVAAFSVVGKVLPALVLPLILIGAILALSVVGALQMRQDEKLSEENFLKLMALSFKYLPWLRSRKVQES